MSLLAAAGGKCGQIVGSSVFVMPRTPANWGGAAALWVTVAGWADAAARAGFDPVIVTPSGCMTAAECLEATRIGPAVTTASNRNRLSTLARQALRDAQRIRLMARYRQTGAASRISNAAFVWQHHDLFHTLGHEIARRQGVPLIEYVHAPVVWEARRWGVRRPGWGTLLERLGDAPQLRRADLIACVTAEVAERVVELGAAPERVAISPMGVDPVRFSPNLDEGSVGKPRFGHLGEFVIGWVGSFRAFHALELAVEAIALLNRRGVHVGLVMAGDGPDKPRLEQLCRSHGVADRVHFAGQISNVNMPGFLRSLDGAVITAAAGQSFHYSPLKLREYQAVGLAVAAPRIGEMGRSLAHRATAMLYEPGDASGLADCLLALSHDRALRKQIGDAGRSLVLETGTWDVLLRQALTRIEVATP